MAIRGTGKAFSVQVWIELSIAKGHVELKARRTFWGFYPDQSSDRVKVPDSDKNPANSSSYSSISGGYLGKLLVRSQADLAHDYINDLKAQAPLHGKRIPFFRFRFSATGRQVAFLQQLLLDHNKKGVEYNIFNSGTGVNCVGFTIQALKACKLLPARFSLTHNKPSPFALWQELLMRTHENPDIRFDVKWLEPPTFK